MVYIGRFNESQIKSGADKIAIEQAKKETGLNYVESKIIYKNKKPIALDLWVCNANEFTL